MGSAKTRFSFSTENALSVKADVLIIPVFKKATSSNGKKDDKNVDPKASIVWPVRLEKALNDEINAIAIDEKFDGSKGKLLSVRQSSANKLNARRLIVVGLGEAEKILPRHWEAQLVKAVGSALAIKDPNTIAILLPETTEGLSQYAIVSLAVDAVYQGTYKSMEAKEPPVDLQKALLIIDSKASSQQEAFLAQAIALADARSLTKDLVNHPSNLKRTDTLVEHAKRIGKNPSIKVNVQSSVDWIEKNMPCFFTVAKGSVATDPPKFITMRYTPKSGKAKKHIAIVGKSVIFDTGGYQVKPGDHMVTMKGDMTGGAVTLATMQALSQLQLENIEVTVYMAATPNKIDSDAMIPDSIVNTTCGKKVEIRHTDAEGRLTLIDAVAKAVENKPDEIITIATLTGAASVAVGCSIALMGRDEALRDRIAVAGKSLGEPLQTLDVTEDDFDNIKSKLDGADIINTSQRRHRGAQTAAAFVMSGASDTMPMAHLDIAGADMTPDEKATGISAKTIVQYLLNEDANLGGSTRTSRSTGGSGATRKAASTTSKTAAKPATKTAVKTTKAAKPAKSTKAVAKPVKAAKPAKASASKTVKSKAVSKPAKAAPKTKPAAAKKGKTK